MREQGAGQSDVTGYGFMVGEHIDPAGRQVFVVVTADHVVRGPTDPGRSVLSPQVTYRTDPTRMHGTRPCWTAGTPGKGIWQCWRSPGLQDMQSSLQ